MTETEQMLTEILSCRRVDLYTQRPVLTPQQEARLTLMQERRRAHEPLQYILGDTEFMGLKIAVDPRVLIPRPETELLVEAVLQRVADHAAPLRVLDLGTGSGNMAIALAKSLPASHVTGIDISQPALDVARANAVRHDVGSRVRFLTADMRALFLQNCPDGMRFDIVVSNPPYISSVDLPSLPADVRREPQAALDGGLDGLDFYRAIISGLSNVLRPGGLAAFEIGDGQAGAVQELWLRQSAAPLGTIEDYTGTERVMLGCFVKRET